MQEQHSWIDLYENFLAETEPAKLRGYLAPLEEIAAAVRKGGIAAGETTMIRLLQTDHLNDQMAALAWLKKSRILFSHAASPRQVIHSGA
jgi:hypothetical protein